MLTGLKINWNPLNKNRWLTSLVQGKIILGHNQQNSQMVKIMFRILWAADPKWTKGL
jgi:hypothetical protein